MIGRNLVAIVIFAVMVSSIGCDTKTSSPTQPATTDLPLKIARGYWPGQYWVDIAREKGWFNEAGLNVEFVDAHADYFGSLSDMVAGKIDSQNFSLFDLMKFNLEGANLVMVINADNSNGAEAILSGVEIQSLKDLKGKRIGLSKGSYLEYMLNEVLSRQGMAATDIVSVDMLSENAKEEIDKDNVAAVMTYEPFVSDILGQKNYRKLFDSSEIPGISPNGIIFRRSFIDERPGDVQAVVNTWHKATLFIRENPKEALAIISKLYNQSMGDVQAFMQTDKVLDLRENTTAFSFGSGYESLHGAARKINVFLIDNEITDKQMDSTEFIDGQFIRSLVENSE